MSARRRHFAPDHLVGPFARLVCALWFIAVLAIQPALALGRPGAAASTDSHHSIATNTGLFISPADPLTLVGASSSVSNPPTENRGPDCGPALAKSHDALEMRFGSYLAVRTAQRPLRASGHRAETPRAPPFVRG